MSTITMGSLMNELNNAAMSVDTSGTAPSARPQLSARSNSGALDMNLQTTLAGITASQKSINQALNKVRSAKAMAAEKRRQATLQLKMEREEEKMEALEFNRQKAAMKKELLVARSQMGMEFIRHRAQHAEKEKQNRRLAAVREGHFKSSRDREGRRLLKETEQRRKRYSMATRREVRQNNKEGEEKLKQMRDDEERRLLEERKEGILAAKEFKRKQAEDRRKSMAGRNQAWSRIKQVEEQLNTEAAQASHESYELKWAGEKDADAYKRKLKEDRRKSMEGRNESESRARKWAEEARQQQLMEEAQSFELTRLAHNDVSNYKKQMAKEEQMDYQKRNEDGFDAKQRLEEQRMDSLHKEAESYELTRLAHNDVSNYKKQMAKEEQMDYQKRNEDGFDAKQRLEELRMNQLHADAESYELTRLAHNDVSNYKKQMAKEEQMDYQKRNEDGFDAKQRLEEQRMNQLHADAESYELTRLAHNDVSNYKKQMAKEEQMDYQKRNEDGFDAKQRLEEQRMDQLHADAQSYELTRLAHNDVSNYKKQMAKEEQMDYQKRNEDGFDAKQRLEEQRMNQLHADAESYELTRLAHNDVSNYKKQMAKEEQMDYQKRNEDGFDAKQRLEEQRMDQLHADAQSYELTRLAHNDVSNYKKQMAKEEQMDYQKRNEDGFDAKQRLEELRMDQLHADAQSYELTRLAHNDVSNYKKQMAMEEQMDYQKRNEDGFDAKRRLEEQRMDQLNADHESYELKWAGQRDADDYKKQMAEERRQSFAMRNENHSQQCRVMAELESIQKEKAHESHMLNWAAANDALAYQKQMEEERRLSFQQRGEMARVHKEVEEEQRQTALQQQYEDSELSADAARDVADYKSRCAARDRASLCFRNKEARIQRLEEESREVLRKEKEDENRALDDAARNDVKMYVERCKRRKRLSLVGRAMEARHAAHVQQERKEEEQRLFRKEVRNRQMDAKYVQLFKERERAMIAMEALRHKGCTFAAMNPFAAILE
ncbi:hypothetical protein TrCOL_g12589 [Triparma columacea]|nr:hypothetical protein TrCOL_g12589 [Triparma columacea]